MTKAPQFSLLAGAKIRITQRSDGVWKVIAYQINLFFAVKFEFGIENSVRCEIEKLQKLRTEYDV